MTRETVKKTVEEAARVASDSAAEALDFAKKEAAVAAGRASETLRSQAEAGAEAGKDMVSDQGLKLAERLRAGADADDLQSRILNVVAGSVAEMSEDLRGRSLPSLVDETERFARSHPSAFVAGAALAGFALARFARASGAPLSGHAPVTAASASVPGQWPAAPAGRPAPQSQPAGPALTEPQS